LRTLGADAHWDRLNILLPVGISFYTFQTMSYAIQVYRRQIPACRDFLHFALYVSFFPQLVAGPIERATNLLPQLGTYQRVVWEDIAVGLKRIVLGFFRKMVLADRFALCVNHVFQDPANQPTAAIWVAAFAFMCQITYDFAGYSDIAVGSARLFGVRLTENFRRPMMSLSQAEFWARWHITLTSWLRDYLFQPLGGFRKGWQRALLNGWIVLLICGLWHGASWNFVVWGAVEALYISIYYFWRYLSRDVLGLRRETGARLTPLRLLGWALTVLANVLVCGICFRSPNLATMKQMALGLVGAHPGAAQPAQWDVWFFAGLVAVCLIVEFFQEYLDLNGRLRRLPVAVRAALLTALAALIAVLSVNNASPYIYFRF
jgi:D-alanyl-lipoteichoic acid acyltransferase DltB (MBOAT superfamily)